MRFRNGEKSVFKEIYAHAVKIIGSLLSGREKTLKPYQDDIYQECWITFIKQIKDWDPSRGSARVFLYVCFDAVLRHFNTRKYASDVLLGDGTDAVTDPHTEKVENIDVTVTSRFRGDKSVYVVRRSITALILGVQRAKIIRELKELTGFNRKRVVLLFNYSTVQLRKRALGL